MIIFDSDPGLRGDTFSDAVGKIQQDMRVTAGWKCVAVQGSPGRGGQFHINSVFGQIDAIISRPGGLLIVGEPGATAFVLSITCRQFDFADRGQNQDVAEIGAACARQAIMGKAE